MAENIRQKLVHLHTSEKKVPTKDILELGEIAVQHNNDEAALYIKKNDGTIAKFIDDSAVDTKIAVETTRAEGIEDGLADRIRTLEGSNHTHENKDVLDGIDANKVAAWSAAEANAISSAKTYTDSVASGKANTVHTHAIADVTGLQGALDGKAASAHTHAIADVTGLQSALDGKDSKGAAAQALTDAKTYVDGKVDGKFDAAGAAAKALTDAKSYADGLNTAMDGRVDVLEASSHTHENKGVLDKITDAKVTAWDAAEGNAKKYTDDKIAVLKIDCGTY